MSDTKPTVLKEHRKCNECDNIFGLLVKSCPECGSEETGFIDGSGEYLDTFQWQDDENEEKYKIKTYTDVFESPSEVEKVSSLPEVFHRVFHELEILRNEGNGYNVGMAGDGELFEIYPKVGHGSIVVSEINRDEDDEEGY